MNYERIILSSLMALLAINTYAANEPRVMVASSCFLNSVNASYETLSSSNEFKLFKINDADVSALSEAKSHRTNKPCGGFMDVSREWKEYNIIHPGMAKEFLDEITKPMPSHKHKYAMKYPTQVNSLLNKMNPQDMWKDLTSLTNFPDRYARSDNGVKAAEWLKDQVETMAKNTGHNDVNVYFVQTGDNYKQPSVVAKIGDSNNAAIVIGGHMDTLSSSYSKKPGADDDGTGTVTVLEAARTILNSGMKFKNPIYFIWYSAEEEGLIGSSYVVKDFKNKNIPVDSVIQFDMTGYAYNNDPTIWLINDYVDKDLTLFLKKLVKTYVKKPIGDTRCGYACSDHASWYKGGFTSSMPFEASFGNDNPAIHTSNDTMEKLTLAHMASYAKLAVAFAVELGEPVS